MNHRTGLARNQTLLFPESLEDYVNAENPIRFLDAFVQKLDLRTRWDFPKPRSPRPAAHLSILWHYQARIGLRPFSTQRTGESANRVESHRAGLQFKASTKSGEPAQVARRSRLRAMAAPLLSRFCLPMRARPLAVSCFYSEPSKGSDFPGICQKQTPISWTQILFTQSRAWLGGNRLMLVNAQSVSRNRK